MPSRRPICHLLCFCSFHGYHFGFTKLYYSKLPKKRIYRRNAFFSLYNLGLKSLPIILTISKLPPSPFHIRTTLYSLYTLHRHRTPFFHQVFGYFTERVKYSQIAIFVCVLQSWNC